MTGLELRQWAISWGFTATEAAEALGIGRSSYFKWLKTMTIPENVRLACVGYDAVNKTQIYDKYKLLKRKYDRIEKIINEGQS